MAESKRVVIVGGGLAGLSCARRLAAAGADVLVLEREPRVGGRVVTDEVDGFLLDRGFQVFLSAYPEARRQLDYEALELQPFYPGALVWTGGGLVRVSDPWRRPLQALGDLLRPVASLGDLWRVGRLRADVLRGGLEALFERPETTTLERLRRAGFSDGMIERFFRPFFGGIFLEAELQTSSRMFDFVFRMMAAGETVLPRRGMARIPSQLADGLPAQSLRLGTAVRSLEPGEVVLESGERIEAAAVVVATDGQDAARLEAGPPAVFQSVTCLYFAAARPPVDEPILVLNGSGQGIVNNVAVPSSVSRSYAPEGQALISVSVLGVPEASDAALESAVREELGQWFGDLAGWRLLRTYRIERALPRQVPPALAEPHRPVRTRPGLYVCGDHRDNASINGAMVSGRRAAEAVLADAV